MATKTLPAILNVICKSMAELFVSTVEKKKRAKPRIIQFRTHNLITVLIIVLFPSVYGPCFWSQVGPPLSLFTIKMAKIWQNRGALDGTHWRVPTNFILYVSSLMLVLLSYY